MLDITNEDGGSPKLVKQFLEGDDTFLGPGSAKVIQTLKGASADRK